jgi:adenylate kinase
MKTQIIFLGPPGTGKGTMAKKIHKKYGLVQISTGDLFRDNIKNKTVLGKKVQKLLDSGELMPDQLTFDMLKDRLGKEDLDKGFILDGYPRTIPQAELLEKDNVEIHGVFNFIAKEKTILQRLGGRWTCKKCGEIFHETNMPPKKAGICDNDGGELYQRDDQKPAAIKVRLKEYKNKTEPLITYYKKKGLLIDIDTERSVDEIFQEVCDAVK